MLSGRARDAFDLASEEDATRDLYGRKDIGQNCLLARRREPSTPSGANGPTRRLTRSTGSFPVPQRAFLIARFVFGEPSVVSGDRFAAAKHTDQLAIVTGIDDR